MAPQLPEKRTAIQSPEDPVVVRVENISKNYGPFKALDQISFEVRQGEVLGVLGPNGAGKTTTVRILSGFFPPTEGKVWIGNEDLFRQPEKTKRRIGYLPESVSLYENMRVSEFLDFVAQLKAVSRKKRKDHIEEKIERCGLWEVRRRLIGHLSKGYRQRVGLAQALIADPDVLILDEPTNGLDPKQIIEIRTLIQELGKDRTLILSTHILPEVSMVCDRVIIMNKGKVVASGTTDELEAGLKKPHEIFVTVGRSAVSKEEALRILKSLPGAGQINLAEEREDQISFSVVSSKGEDLRPEISRLFVENKIPLLEIRAGRLSLEEIFMKIVVNEGPAEKIL